MNLYPVVFLCIFFGVSTEGARILGIFQVPTKSHIAIGTAVLKKLAERGHDVTIATAFASGDKQNNYREIYLDGLLAIGDESRDKMFSFTNQSKIEMFQHFSTFTTSLVLTTLQNPKIQQLIKSGEKFDVVMLEPFNNEAFLGFGHVFNAQIVIIGAGGSGGTNQFVGNVAPYSFVPNLMTTFTDKMTFLQRVVNTAVALMLEVFVQFVVTPAQKQIYEEYFKGGPSYEEAVKNVSLVLVNSHVMFETPRPYLPNMIPIGGAHIKEPKKLSQELQTFLDNAKDGAIFFSLGSNLNSKFLPDEKIQTILKTFAKFPQKFLWKFEDDSLTKKLPKNVKISKWYPQTDILAHPNVKLFITHGGLLSSTEAVYRGVPIIGIPFYGDQFANVAQFVSSGYGQQLLLEDLTEETFTNLIKDVLTNKSYQDKIKQSSAILQDQLNHPLDRAIFWVEHIIKHGAQHLRSTSVDISLTQYLLLDVLLFVSVILGTFIVGIYLSVKTICCRRRRKEETDKKGKRKPKKE